MKINVEVGQLFEGDTLDTVIARWKSAEEHAAKLGLSDLALCLEVRNEWSGNMLIVGRRDETPEEEAKRTTIARNARKRMYQQLKKEFET